MEWTRQMADELKKNIDHPMIWGRPGTSEWWQRIASAMARSYCTDHLAGDSKPTAEECMSYAWGRGWVRR